MENQVVLKKTTFGGFEKQSVLNYIYELNTSTKEAQDKLMAQLEDITTSREKISETLREMETKMQSLQRDKDNTLNELEGERQRTGELGNMIDSLNAQIAKQAHVIAEKDGEVDSVKRLNSELVKKYETLEGQKDDVQKATAHVGELLLKTRLDSEKILADATVKAAELVAEAGKSLENVHTQFDSFKDDMAGLQSQIQDALAMVQQKFAAIGDAVSEAEISLRDVVYPQSPLKLVRQEDCDYSPGDIGSNDFFRSAVEH